MVKDAYRFALPPLIAGIVCVAIGWKWPGGVLIFLGLFVFYFFRDPNRTIPSDPAAVVSPADGHVVESEYGCGAHSDTPQPQGTGSPLYDPFDDGVLDVVQPES